jgi:hypothetical protein
MTNCGLNIYCCIATVYSMALYFIVSGTVYSMAYVNVYGTCNSMVYGNVNGMVYIMVHGNVYASWLMILSMYFHNIVYGNVHIIEISYRKNLASTLP